MTVRSGIISYGLDSTVVRTVSFYWGQPTIGGDQFYGFSDPVYTAHYVGEIQTGEMRLNEDGGKCNVMNVWLRTYTEGTTMPGCVCMVRGTKESSWTAIGDSVGTISVGTSSVTGTGTAWSNTLGTHTTGATTTLTTPCLAANATIYEDTNLLTAGTDYTIDSAQQITVAATVGSGTIYCYWSGYPYAKMTVGDYIYTSEGFHRVATIPTATSVTLDWYPSTTLTGTHYTGKALPSGEGETIFGVNRMLDTLQLRFLIVPRYISTAATVVKPLSFTVEYVSSGERQKKL